MNRLRFPKSRRHFVMGTLLLLALFITACGSSAETWPGVAEDPNSDDVFISFNNVVTRLNNEGSRQWIYESDGATFYAPALVTDETVYVGDYKGRLHAINRDNGDDRWIYEPERDSFLFIEFGANDRIIGKAEYYNGTIFFGTETGVFALDEGEGDPKIKWSFTDADHSIWAPPVYADTESIEPTLFVASLDKHLYALDAETGESNWKLDLNGAMPGRPTVDFANEILYIGTLESKVYAISFTGDILATYETEGWVWSSPAYDEATGALFVGDLDGYVYEIMLNTETNEDDEVVAYSFEEMYKNQVADAAIRSQPVIIDNVLIVGSEDKRIYAINLEEDNRPLRWTFEDDDIEQEFFTDIATTTIDGEPAIVVGTKENDHVLLAISASGERLWTYEYQEND